MLTRPPRTRAPLAIVLALVVSACRPPATESPAAATSAGGATAPARQPAGGLLPKCGDIQSLCFANRSENPAHVVWWLCDDDAGTTCHHVGDIRVAPKSSCLLSGPELMGKGARSIRVQIGDAGEKITLPFCCPGRMECDCLAAARVDYDGYFLKGDIVLTTLAGRSCTYPLAPEDPGASPVHLPPLDCPKPCEPLPEPTGLKSLSFTSYLLDKDVDSTFTSTSFDIVTLDDLQHAVKKEATRFTFNGQPADPRPTEVTVAYTIDGAAQTGATVTAGAGRFISTVSGSLADVGQFTVTATQDDGTTPSITYP